MILVIVSPPKSSHSEHFVALNGNNKNCWVYGFSFSYEWGGCFYHQLNAKVKDGCVSTQVSAGLYTNQGTETSKTAGFLVMLLFVIKPLGLTYGEKAQNLRLTNEVHRGSFVLHPFKVTRSLQWHQTWESFLRRHEAFMSSQQQRYCGSLGREEDLNKGTPAVMRWWDCDLNLAVTWQIQGTTGLTKCQCPLGQPISPSAFVTFLS